MRVLIALILISTVLQGCLGTRNAINQDVVFLQSAPVCNTDIMCKQMWYAAEQWVDRYSPQGMVVSDDLIQSDSKELGSDDMEIEIKKIKLKNGHYKILIDNTCTSSMSSCDIERNNMIAFNKELMKFMSVKDQAKNKKVFTDNNDIKKWFELYAQCVSESDSKSFSGLVHFPVSYVEKDEIKVLSTDDQAEEFLKSTKTKISSIDGHYLKHAAMNVFVRTSRNSYVNAVFELYDAEGVIVGAQQLDFHLVNIDKKWKMISSSVHID